MTVVIVSPDLIISTRIGDAVAHAGLDALRVDRPDDLPPAAGVRLAFVDWAARDDSWGSRLAAWCASAPETDPPRMVLFGPHTDLAAHAAARATGLGPMMARSALVSNLPHLLDEAG